MNAPWEQLGPHSYQCVHCHRIQEFPSNHVHVEDNFRPFEPDPWLPLMNVWDGVVRVA